MDKKLTQIMDIGEQMLVCGGEVSRVEESIKRMAAAYGAHRSDVFIITSSMVVTVEDQEGVCHTRTRRVTSLSTDIEKLHRLNGLVRRICASAPDCDKVSAELDSIRRVKPYPAPVTLFSYGFISSAFTLFFGGGAIEALCALPIGLILGLLVLLCDRGSLNRIFAKLLCSFTAAVLAFSAVKLHLIPTADHVIIGYIMTLIPGVGLTNALRDLFVGDSITGVLRTIEAVLFALAIAGGYFLALFTVGGVF